jgi:uncharacterized short protein YbdD (DUF466 family)
MRRAPEEGKFHRVLPANLQCWLRRIARNAWRGLREWCGDAAYEHYLRSPVTKSGQSPTLTAEQFYIEQLDRRYSRPNRCC